MVGPRELESLTSCVSIGHSVYYRRILPPTNGTQPADSLEGCGSTVSLVRFGISWKYSVRTALFGGVASQSTSQSNALEPIARISARGTGRHHCLLPSLVFCFDARRKSPQWRGSDISDLRLIRHLDSGTYTHPIRLCKTDAIHSLIHSSFQRFRLA
jgi:hypothetical protein